MSKPPSEQQPRDRALLIIDMVPRLVGPGPDAVPGADRLIPYIQGELRYFRERDRMVVFVTTMEAGRDVDPVVDDLTPRTSELLLLKPAPSAFFQTPLAEVLTDRGVGRVTLVGLGTATSVLLTAADAYARGFGVSVPDPCVIDRSEADHAAALHLIRDVWRPLSADPTLNEVTGPAHQLLSADGAPS